MFCSLGICTISRDLNRTRFSLVRVTCFFSNKFLLLVSPLTWDTNTFEFCHNLTSYTPISNANMRPSMKVSCYTWLLVMVNSKHMDTSTLCKTSLLKIRLAPLALLLDYPFVNKVHIHLVLEGGRRDFCEEVYKHSSLFRLPYFKGYFKFKYLYGPFSHSSCKILLIKNIFKGVVDSNTRK